jgi:hypothetical protein
VRNRLPPPTSLKEFEDVLQEQVYKIPLETVQNLYESIPRMTAAIVKATGGPRRKIYTQNNGNTTHNLHILSVVFPLFCSTPVHLPSVYV